ncbi:MAG: helix-turn-helix domain-containing protein [Peptostreptococcus sp.]|nr:sigma factor-like helix-turn-helix DNA-binding protein [Peptostreptococcus sp.]MDU5350431.1 helix-turn-helix domain-containing protein [Peptostreptococcus sp.]MDU5891252.1 helix-turn-helix domain-containing protein [Peptostreptococcus sp.]CCY47840.1 putative uncharacterized protein [Peptostreptococcus anaerobius CAG:621]
MNLDEMKATRSILDEVIEKQEQEQIEKQGYREIIEPTRQELNLMTVKEISKKYGIGQERIRQLIHASRENSNNFPFIKMGRRALIPEHMFKEWLIEACKEGLQI